VLLEIAAFPNDMHSGRFYRATAITLPLILALAARASRLRWPATTTAAIYTGIALTMVWVLQAFPATAKLAPIYNPVTHMVPPPFPLLLVVPALGIDLLMHRVQNRGWPLALGLGAMFVALMLVAHWWWAGFLLSPHGRNAFFAADQWDYYLQVGAWRYQFWRPDATAGGFALALLIAVATAATTSRIGLWIGSGMTRVQR
jgi:hypothetical protein